MNLKTLRILLITVISSFLISCGTAYHNHYGQTAFSNEEIRLGDSKESVIKKYGKPYIQEIELIDGKTVETIGYKEGMYYGYHINTFFIFEDGKLIKKIQEEELPKPEIKINKQ